MYRKRGHYTVVVVVVVTFVLLNHVCLQCFDAVGWAAGRASGQ